MKQTISILMIFVFCIFDSDACDCPLRPDTKEDFEKEWNRVENVIELIIIEVIKEPKEGEYFGTRILKAKILKIHKGHISSETIKIHTEYYGGAMCEYYFKLRESYLFYGGQGENDNYYYTSTCHRTGKLSERQFDLKMIKEI